MSDNPTLTADNRASWLAAIWPALECYREACAPEGKPEHDQEWDEICTAMAWIREALDLPEEVSA